MKVYLAGPYAARELLGEYAIELADIGISVTSRWLLETHDITPGTQKAAVDLSDEEVSAHAIADLADVEAADVLVLFTAANVGFEGGGGRHVETGVAIALNKPVVVVGEPENVFHRMGFGVRLVQDWPDAVRALSEYAAARFTQVAR